MFAEKNVRQKSFASCIVQLLARSPLTPRRATYVAASQFESWRRRRRLAAATASDRTHAEMLALLAPAASFAAHSTRVRSSAVKRTGIGSSRRCPGASGGLPGDGIPSILVDYINMWTGYNLSTTLIG